MMNDQTKASLLLNNVLQCGARKDHSTKTCLTLLFDKRFWRGTTDWNDLHRHALSI